MQAIILAGGKGTRLFPYTNVLPKPLMPIGDMPILEIIIRQLKKYGIIDITVSVGYLAGLIETFFGDGRKFGVKINYSMENEPLGTAGPLSLISPLNETFLLMNGDVLTSLNYTKFIEYHRTKESCLTIGLHSQSYQIPLGYIEHDLNYNVTNYIEKPEYKFDVGMGIYLMEPEILDYIEKGNKLDIPELVMKLISDKKKIVGYPTNEYWLDMGKHEEYDKAINDFEKNRHLFV
jgi:NDP-sugar pyrophosphorylase family protein